MSCKYCNNGEKQYSFDGMIYIKIRLGQTLGYPAILAEYDDGYCCDSYGINFCPWCGQDLREVMRNEL